MAGDEELYKLAVRLGHHLMGTGRTLVSAESCTGGWIGKVITDVPGSSGWYRGGVVSYSDELKMDLLSVSKDTLDTHGAVSDATVLEMATGALERLGGDLAVAVTGIAGPSGETQGKPVGTIWIGWAWRHGQAVHTLSRLKIYDGDRDRIRRRTVWAALNGVVEI
jgi:nicotinamide-nucleotide amidase